MKRCTKTPREDGFRMPGEFEKHAGTYIIWPQRPDNWRFGGETGSNSFCRSCKNYF